MKKTITIFLSLILVILMGFNTKAQITLTGTSYLQDFDGISSGFPTGWTIKLHATSTSLGSDTVLTTTKTKWNSTTRGAFNYASADGLTAASDSSAQANSTDRVIGMRQISSVGDPGVAFTMQIANTTNMNTFGMTFKLQSLDASSPRVATWVVQYATGATPTSFTDIASVPTPLTTGNSLWSNTSVTVNFGALLDNLAGPVWIRIVTLAATSGGGNRPTSAIDDVNLTWTNGAATTVAAPSFSPLPGTYYGAVNVTLSSSTPGASIYYTTDGSTPTTSSTLYSAPFAVSQTSTVNAIGIKNGLTNSSVATAVYTINVPVVCANIAALRSKPADNSTVYKLTGEAILTCKITNRNQKYIQDASAAILIDDPSTVITTTYSVGDGITGITGKLQDYFGLLEFVPIQNPGAPTSGQNNVTPLVLTAANMLDTALMRTHQSKLIKLENIAFTDAGTFANGKKYRMTQGATTDTMFYAYIYSVDYIGQAIPSGNGFMVGVVNYSYNRYLITARNKADISLLSAIGELDNSGIGIYPNPTNGKFTLNIDKINNGEVKIYSMVGSLILSQQVSKGNNEFDLSNYGKGMYFVKFTDKSGKSWTEKLIVK